MPYGLDAFRFSINCSGETFSANAIHSNGRHTTLKILSHANGQRTVLPHDF